jgi:DnaJ family protein B protein 12
MGGGMGGRGMGGGFGGEELSPEDLFRFFFGQQGGAQFGGGGFGGGGGGFRTQFYGPGGIHMSTGGRRAVPNGGNAAAEPTGSVWLQLAPLLLLFGFSLLTQLPSFFGLTAPADPDFNFSPSERYNVPRTSASDMAVPYFVSAREFSSHPIYVDIVDANPSLGFKSKAEKGSSSYRHDLLRHILATPKITDATVQPVRLVSPPSLKSFEKKVERSYVHTLQSYCQQEIGNRNQQMEQARGFLGIGRDLERVSPRLSSHVYPQLTASRCADQEDYRAEVRALREAIQAGLLCQLLVASSRSSSTAPL